MTSSSFGNPKMILPYEWILENVEEEPMTIASKMILFRGERVFRVGLTKSADSDILFFMAINLSKIGLKVEDVMYRIPGSGTGIAPMVKMTKEDIGEEGSLQLFTIKLTEKVLGNCTFSFRIVLEGVIPCYLNYGYSYQLCDRLAKDQLWAALKSQQNMADVEVIVKDKTFFVHKAILAARSRVFADEFSKEKPGKDGPHQVRLDGVEPTTVENFLYFVYTGEPKGTLANEELLKLANKYSLTTLLVLCQNAQKEITAAQMGKLMGKLNNGVETLNSSKIMPEKVTEIFFDRTTPTFRCALNIFDSKKENSICMMQYQKEELFFAYITVPTISKRNSYVINFTCAKHRSFGLKVEDIYCGLKEQNQWFKMEPKKLKNSTELLLSFGVQLQFVFPHHMKFNFDIKVVSTISNYYYEMMDDKWLNDLWTAARNKKLTDVEIFVGTVKVMEAHRVILSARSPILNESLNKISNTAEKSIVTFGEEFDVEVVESFLKFLYTGRLELRSTLHEPSAEVKQLSKLATTYEVETLKNMCQLLNVNPTDVEELTNYLLQL